MMYIHRVCVEDAPKLKGQMYEQGIDCNCITRDQRKTSHGRKRAHRKLYPQKAVIACMLPGLEEEERDTDMAD